MLYTNSFDFFTSPPKNIVESLIKLPTTGSIIQEGDAKGFWQHDGWAGSEVKANFCVID